MRALWWCALLMVGCNGGTDSADACVGCNLTGMADSVGGGFHVTYHTVPDSLVVNEDFDLDVTVYESSDMATKVETATVSADAWMPAHGHGMGVEPTSTANGDGTFLVEGMRFMMPGHWELTITVTDGDRTEDAEFDILMEE